MRCAEAGVRGISVQKPMAISLRECQEMLQMCRRNGAILKVYENFLFYPVYVKAKELLDSGVLGEPISIRVTTHAGKREGAPWPQLWDRQSWRNDMTKAGTTPLVGDDGFHKFSLARWFMGRDLATIGAWIDRDTSLDAPAIIRGRFHRTDGERSTYAQLDFSFSPRMSTQFDFWLDDFVEIVTEGGVMWINQCSAAGDRPLFQGNRMSDSPVFPPIATFSDGTVTTYLADISPSERNWSTSFVASTRHFIDVMLRGGEPIHSGEDGMEIMRYITAAIVSAKRGGDVDLAEISVDAESRGDLKINASR
jgi:predicted dehydrogenase